MASRAASEWSRRLRSRSVASKIRCLERTRNSIMRSKQSIAMWDTAHGFQGDERDVIIFSYVRPRHASGARWHFLRESGNLSMVAASRARAVLHVVGNRPWAKGLRHPSCGALRRLRTSARAGTVRTRPLVSALIPLGEILNDALVVEGLDPRPPIPRLRTSSGSGFGSRRCRCAH